MDGHEMRSAWKRAHREARRGQLSGARLFAAILEATRAKGAYDGRRGLAAIRMQSALEPRQVLSMRAALQHEVLNGFGMHNPWRAPAMDSPRFEGWRRFACRASALRERLLARGMIQLEAGGYVSSLLPLSVEMKSIPLLLERAA